MSQSRDGIQNAKVSTPEKAPSKHKKDMHFPNIILNHPFRKLFDPSQKYNTYVAPGQVVADLGCGPGYFTLPLAECVGPEGRVYAVDSYIKAIRSLEKKVLKRGIGNVETRVSSAADLSFIPDRSVDFVLADGLFCCVAPDDLDAVVSEIKRILKANGKAYLVSGLGFPGYMDNAAWEKIMAEFAVEGRSYPPYKADCWALVALKQP